MKKTALKILTIVLVMNMALSMSGCSSKVNKGIVKELKPTDRVSVEFTKGEDGFCSDAGGILRISHLISNLRYNQSILIREIVGEDDE